MVNAKDLLRYTMQRVTNRQAEEILGRGRVEFLIGPSWIHFEEDGIYDANGQKMNQLIRMIDVADVRVDGVKAGQLPPVKGILPPADEEPMNHSDEELNSGKQLDSNIPEQPEKSEAQGNVDSGDGKVTEKGERVEAQQASDPANPSIPATGEPRVSSLSGVGPLSPAAGTTVQEQTESERRAAEAKETAERLKRESEGK